MGLAIKIDNVSKLYRLGTVGTGTISHDLNRWWHAIRGKEDPYSKVGQVNDRTMGAKSKEQRAKSDTSSSLSQSPSLCSPGSRFAGLDYVWALRDINLEVQQGEILGIIGRNGAGKSTLLKLLSRVSAPTTGSIKTKGRIASLLEVGTGFHPDLTGRENIYLNGAILGMKRHEITSRLDQIVEFSGCARYLDTPVKRYSSGMMVRLGFAVAAHLDCEILIVDEVLAVGDAEFQRLCTAKMKDISKNSARTILFVSHNLDAISSLCTQAVILSTGQTVATGSANDMIDQYAQRLRASPASEVVLPAAARLSALRLTCHPASVESGGSAKVTLTLQPAETQTIAGLTLVISNDAGVRIGILDLRAEFHSMTVAAGETLTLSGEIGGLSLVEGCYSIGIFLQSNLSATDIPDCGQILVLPSSSRGRSDLAPFPARYRGSVEFQNMGFKVLSESSFTQSKQTGDI